MCGIAGYLNLRSGERAEPSVLRPMLDAIRHRGPDDEGLFAEGPAGLAMRRLSIVDLRTGGQPLSNEDGSVWIVFNGEIYNFQELRERLLKLGHVFKTRSDTEVILHLYEEKGDDCVDDLRGMFAFSLWDAKRRRLLLARDRLGKKPLYYASTPTALAWASELQSLMRFPGLSREVEPAAIDAYLSLQYVPSPLTAYKAVKKLPAGHRLILENGVARVERYWEPPTAEAERPSFEEAKLLVREKLREATRLRMIADVPLGAFLSGGIDSACVVALMAEASSRPVKTFSVGFEEAEFSELEYAREVASRYGTDHAEVVLRPEVEEILPMLARHYGEPFADHSALPTFVIARQARRDVTVALSGDGGDECFGGYTRYLGMKRHAALRALPRPVRAATAAAFAMVPAGLSGTALGRLKSASRDLARLSPLERYYAAVVLFGESEKRRLYHPAFAAALGQGEPALEYLRGRYAEAPGLNAWMRLDLRTYLPDCLMAKTDVATMAASLEGRMPFLDHELVELAARLPAEWKVRGSDERGTKFILKEAFKDLLPPRIYGRGKKGFGIPIGGWLRTRLKGYWENLVLAPEALARGYFQAEALRALWTEHQSGLRDHGSRLWGLMMLELWHREEGQ